MSARMEPLGHGLEGQVMTVLRQARQYPKRSEESPTVKALAHSRGVTSLSVIASSAPAGFVGGWGGRGQCGGRRGK